MRTSACQVTLIVAAMLAVLCIPTAAHADITDFNQWTLVEDPAHPGLTYSVDSASQITLSATGSSIPVGTDIGFQSVNGVDVASSTQGWAFSPLADLSVAVSFDLSRVSPDGGFSIGFGIGEDGNGTDSAGIVLASQKSNVFGDFLLFAGAGRVNDANRAVGINAAGQLTGRFLVSYEAASGDVTVGVSTDGDNTAEGSGTFTGIQNEWDNEDLLVSFFARGDNGLLNWKSGTADAVFSNFEVISGTPSAVPEPSAFLVCLIGLVPLGLLLQRTRRQG